MKLNEKDNIIGIQIIDKHLRLGVSSDKGTKWYRIFSNTKGRYIKKHDDETEKVKNFYIKDNLFWAVYKFEEYLKENDCVRAQSNH